MYVKRQTIAKTWPISRKGTKYVVRASHDKKNGIPLLIILRDMLKVTENRKEVKKVLREKKVEINEKIARKENLSVLPFDIIKIGEKRYELGFSDKGKFMVRETKRTERILKVTGKKILRKGRTQLNLLYGKNLLTDKKVATGESIIIKGKNIEKVLPVEKNREVVIFAGKYKGREGKIEKIEESIATISYKNEKINVPVENIMVIK